MTPCSDTRGRRVVAALTASVALLAFLLSTSTGEAAPRGRQVIVSAQGSGALDLRGMSGDGRYVLYAYEDDGRTQLRLVDNDSGEDTIISDPGDDADSAVIAPGGESVAYIDYDEEGAPIGLVLYDVATDSRDRFPRPEEAGVEPVVLAIVENGTVIVLVGGEDATAPLLTVDTQSTEVERLDISALCRELDERIEGCMSTVFDPSISRNGDWVAFGEERTCPDDEDDDCEPAVGLFVYSSADGSTVEVASPGDVSPGMNLDVTDNGAFVLFGCWLIARESGDAEWVSVRPSGYETEGCTQTSMTPDAKFVAFSPSGEPDPESGSGSSTDRSIFVRDMDAGITILGTLSTVDNVLVDFTYQPFLSDDGRRLAFRSSATNLVGDDKDMEDDIFVTTWFTYTIFVPGIARE